MAALEAPPFQNASVSERREVNGVTSAEEGPLR
ncbi:hypothetical protein EDF52_12115 [Curtobacterium sp. PhB42]|nr:hypothetical protein EDF48_10816 [Curtobacterium sp. PhB191]TDW39163.1 hypothetical protein EDF52_12115 [Curtobacterium sp. PhB42]TDW50755.1 hypothetical protein EDF47_11613 [Curtobacterium sp. PhB190]